MSSDFEDFLLLMLAHPIDLVIPAVGHLLELLELAADLIGAQLAILFSLFELIGRLAAMVAHLDSRLFHALVDDLDQVAPTLLSEGRDSESDRRTVVVGRQSNIALQYCLLDGTQGAAVPRLDQDAVRFGHADAGQLVERRLRAVVLDRDAFDQRRRRTTGADGAQVALERLECAMHATVEVASNLVTHRRCLPLSIRGRR